MKLCVRAVCPSRSHSRCEALQLFTFEGMVASNSVNCNVEGSSDQTIIITAE